MIGTKIVVIFANIIYNSQSSAFLIPSSPPHTKFKQNIEADVPFEENNITIN